MADITRIKDLPINTTPSPTQYVATDLAATQKVTIQQLVDIGVPVASQAEAEAGVDSTKRMTPLTTVQSIVAQAGVSVASIDQGVKAESAVQPLTNFLSRSVVTRGIIQDDLWDSRVGGFASGSRAPHFIWNDPNQTDLVAGYNSGQQIWVGDNPTATPGVGHAVASTITVTNGKNRNALYGQNILVGASNAGSGYTDGFICGLEINIYADFAATVTNAFAGGNRKNGLELTSQGSAGRVTSAAMVWSADSSGAAWWYHGLSISRVVETGINFERNPGGQTDGINPFGVAAIYDKSNSTAVLKIDGSHSSIFDISTVTDTGIFVKGKTGSATSLLFKNQANFGFDLTLDSGSSSAQASSLTFSDRGSGKFQIVKSNGNALVVFDLVAGLTAMSFDGNTTDAVVIRVGGSEKRIQVGAADSAGTGFRTLRVSN